MTPDERLSRARPRPEEDDNSRVVIVWLAMFAACAGAAVLAWGVLL